MVTGNISQNSFTVIKLIHKEVFRKLTYLKPSKWSGTGRLDTFIECQTRRYTTLIKISTLIVILPYLEGTTSTPSIKDKNKYCTL